MFLKYSLIIVLIFAKYSLCSEEAANTQLRRYRFIVNEAPYTRLCETKPILTVNGQFPGPAIEVHKGETILVDVFNQGKYNITLHWHGVKQLRNPWSDGPEYITQCPIQPGQNFTQKVIFSSEEGTLWWHAHSDWSRATVHGPIIVYPPEGASYPFPTPAGEVPIILGQWWKEEIMQVLEEFIQSGGQPRNSDAYTINGQPGDLYPCSNNDTFTMNVNRGETYLLRIVNAGMNEILFFGVANHTLTLVGTDGSYTKPLTRDYIVIGPGQTMDCLLEANQSESRYIMAAQPYVNGLGVDFDNSTATGILSYYNTTADGSPLVLPALPAFNDTGAAIGSEYSVQSLNSGEVPQTIDERIVSTISINTFPCEGTCQGPNGTRLAASMNNISFVNPSISILEAYYNQVAGVFGEGFPGFPPFVFNYTADVIPVELEVPARGTEVKLVRFGSRLEVVLQGTNLVAGIDHPMHLHGFTFFVVGSGFGNFDPERDPAGYNLVDPQRRNTIIVPRNGWVAIRFTADNPGTWFMHCHFERHLTWGMETVFIVESGGGPAESVLPPPPDMPPC